MRASTLGLLAGLGAGALWGVVFVSPRMLPGVSAAQWANGRFLMYGLVALALMLWPLLRRQAIRWPTAAQFGQALWLSVLGFGAYFWLLALAVQWIGSPIPSLIVGSIPLLMLLIGRPAGMGLARVLPGGLLTAVALLMMVGASHGVGGGGSAKPLWWGLLAAAAATASWTAYAILNARYLKRHPEIDATTWANWLGLATGCTALLGMALVWVFTRESPMPSERSLWPMFLALNLLTGFGASWLATVWWNMASQRLSASLCGQLIVSETLFALLYSFAWDQRWPSLWEALAAALFVGGILAGVRAHDSTH